MLIQLLVIQSRSYSSFEIVSIFLDRIRQVNRSLNAVVVELFDEALAQAKQADILLDEGKRMGPLHGVPITIKESFFMKGTATTIGLDKYKNRVDIITE